MQLLTKEANRTGLVVLSDPIPRVFEKFSFWSKLNDTEQGKLEDETTQLLKAKHQFGLSEIQMGQRLYKIRALLKSHRGAYKQVIQAAHFTERTSYRHIARYERLLKYINQPVLDAMIEHGFTLRGSSDIKPLGEYMDAYESLSENNEPPPEQPTEVLGYIQRLELQRERLKANPSELAKVRSRVEKPGNVKLYSIRNSKEFLLKQNYYLLQSSLRRLPSNQRDDFLEKHVGYALALRGVTGKHFEAQAVPPRYNRHAGRPPTTLYEEG